jgi:hypothetical protein
LLTKKAALIQSSLFGAVSYPLVSWQAMPYLGLRKSGLTAKH